MVEPKDKQPEGQIKPAAVTTKTEEKAEDKQSSRFSNKEILRAYRNLLSLEDSFRTLKKDLIKSESAESKEAAAESLQGSVHDHGPLIKPIENQDFFQSLDMRKISLGVRRRMWFILFAGLLFAAGFAVLSHFMLRTHTAEAVLLYQEYQVPRDELTVAPQTFSKQTIVEMIRLPQNFEAVRMKLALELNPSQLANMVDVVSQRSSNLLTIVATADSPNVAKDIANELALVAVGRSQERYYDQAKSSHEYFKNELALAQQKQELYNKEISDFKSEARMVDLDLSNRAVAQSMTGAEQEYQQAVVEYDSLMVEYENLQRQIGQLPDRVVRYEYEESPLKGRISNKELALLEARTKFGPQNPKVRLLEEEVRQLRKAVASGTFDETREKVFEKNYVKEQLNMELVRLQGKLRAAKQKKISLAEQLAVNEEKFDDVPKEQQEYSRLIRDANAAGEEVRTLQLAMRASESLLESERSDIQIQQLADAGRPKQSFAVRFLPTFGFLLGSCLGLLFILGAEATDKKFRTAKQVRMSYNVPYLMSVPEIGTLTPRNAEEKTLFFVRNLSERLMRIPGAEQAKTLVFTSSTAREGKSTMAYHLACYHQRLGEKVIYVDFDYRRNAYLGGTSVSKPQLSAPSIEECLKGNRSPEELVTRGAKIDTMKAGVSRDMKELIKSERMDNLWKWLEENYDRVIVDSPGIVDDDYGVNLAGLADIILFVIGSSKAEKSFVDASLEEFEERRIRPTALLMTRMQPAYIEDPRIKAHWRNDRWWAGLSGSKTG